MQLSVQEVNGSVDWITVTARSKKAGDSLLDIFNAHKAGRTRDTRFFGFDCLRDENGLTWGQRSFDGLYIYIAPGDVASKTWEKAVPVATKVTRLDLATDVWLREPRDQVRQSSRVVLSPSLDTRMKYTYITGVGSRLRERTGDTLYAGSRQSSQFGRFYDKGLQQKSAPPGKWLRYEIEYKSGAALQIAGQAMKLRPGQLGEWIKCTVHDWFWKRDIIPAFLPDTDTPGAVVRSQMVQTTKEKKLAWLRTQVRPTVQYLFQQGMMNETLMALDIELAYFNEQDYNSPSAQKSAREKTQ